MPFLWFGKGKKEEATMVKDPVCDMDVNPKTAAASYEYEGQTYYFCAPGCRHAFEKDPQKYIAGHRMKM